MTSSADAIVRRLRESGSVFAEDEADLLIGAASSWEELESMVGRRVAGEPLEVVVGWAEFCGRRVLVDAGVFVPRARTRVLVDEAVRLAGSAPVVVDLCCGTGAVGLAILDRLPGATLWATDVDPVAVACARRNVEHEGGRVTEGDLFEALPRELRGRVDLLVVNAPYVPTEAIATMPPEARDHEPWVALDGGADGVDLHRRVAAGAAAWLVAGGHVVIESSSAQAHLTRAALEADGFDCRVVSDVDVEGTAVVGRHSRRDAR